MRPVVLTAVLLVVLMSMSDSAEWSPKEMCKYSYPAIPCKQRPDGGWFQKSSNRCVKVHSKNVNQNHAERACKQYPNSNLVSIHNIVDLCQVQCAMYRASTTKVHYWIGLKLVNKKFVWSDKTEDRNNFSLWALKQPDFFKEKEECVEMNFSGWGFWNDQRCNQKRAFVCEARFH